METRICTKCQRQLPFTPEYFAPNKACLGGASRRCRECTAKDKRRWKVEHVDRVREQRKKWKDENKEKVKASKDRWIAEHEEHAKEYAKKYYAEYHKNHRVNVTPYKTRCRKNRTEYMRKWKQENHESVLVSKEKRRSIKRQLPSTLTADQWDEIKNKFNNCCAYCGESKPLTQDHVVPLSKGGPYTAENIVPACKNCNSKKRTQEFSEWYASQPFYDKQREFMVLGQASGACSA